MGKKKMFDFIPEELQINILACLPMKSLIRFRCVSKTFSGFITNPSFVETHLKRTRNQNKGLRYYHFDKTSSYSCVIMSLAYCYGSYNGQISFPHNFLGFVLFDPSSRETIDIPRPTLSSSTSLHGSFMEFIGFQFDSTTKEYNLVRIMNSLSSDDVIPPLVHVYSIRSPKVKNDLDCNNDDPITSPGWRKVNNDLDCVICYQSRFPLVNRAGHWLACPRRVNFSHPDMILCFDFRSELFREMGLPDCLVGESAIDMNITVLHELLSLAMFKKGLKEKQCSIWVMKEYGVAESWTKLYSIENMEGLERFVAFRRNGDMVFAGENGREFLVSYDSTRTNIKESEIFQGNRYSCRLNTNLESLLFGEENGARLTPSRSMPLLLTRRNKKRENN